VMARLYAAARLLVNFFQPSFKLKEKRREGAKIINHSIDGVFTRPGPKADLRAVSLSAEKFPIALFIFSTLKDRMLRV